MKTVQLPNGNIAAILNCSTNSESKMIYAGIAEYRSIELTPSNRVNVEIYSCSLPDNGIDRPDTQVWSYIAEKTTSQESKEFKIFGLVTL